MSFVNSIVNKRYLVTNFGNVSTIIDFIDSKIHEKDNFTYYGQLQTRTQDFVRGRGVVADLKIKKTWHRREFQREKSEKMLFTRVFLYFLLSLFFVLDGESSNFCIDCFHFVGRTLTWSPTYSVELSYSYKGLMS